MCFYESNINKKQKNISKLCLGLSIDDAIKIYKQKYPGDKITMKINGKYKKILEHRYKEYCNNENEEYWTNSHVIFEIEDCILIDITIH